MIDLINGFIDGLNKIKIPDWVPGFGGMSFNIPRIPRLRIGMDYVRKMIIMHSYIKEKLSLLQKKTQDCEKSAVYGGSILQLLQHRR